jgi:hypothetical protein
MKILLALQTATRMMMLIIVVVVALAENKTAAAVITRNNVNLRTKVYPELYHETYAGSQG